MQKRFLLLLLAILVTTFSSVYADKLPVTAKDHYDQGMGSYNQGKFLEAVKCFDEAIKLDPKIADYSLNNGMAYFMLGKYDEAIKYLMPATEKKNISGEAYRFLGYCYSAKKEIDNAISCLKKSMELDPRMKNRIKDDEEHTKRLDNIKQDSRYKELFK